MSSPNKIKIAQQQLDSNSNSFQLFVSSLREQRPIRHEPSPSEHPLSEQEPQLQSKEIFSEGAKSLYMNSPAPRPTQRCQGDPVLKNHHRLGHANRYTVKQYQLPSHFFGPTRNKLQQHLQNSRIMSSSRQCPSPTKEHPLFRQGELAALHQSTALKHTKNIRKMQDLNSDLALKYCLVNRLTPSSDIEQILLFFVRLLQLLNHSLPEPKIEKYRDCIYFGPGKTHLQEGLLYFFSNSVYYGQLINHTMNGVGTQIFFSPSSIFKGQFKQGKMLGFFQVKAEGQRYTGGVKDRLYHGHGKLLNDSGFVEGEFSEGKLVYTNYQNTQKNKAEKQFIKQTSMIDLPQRKKSPPEEPSRKVRQSYENSRNYQGGSQYQWSNSRITPVKQQDEFDFDPYNSHRAQKKVSRVTQKVDSSDVMEFSYPFGQQLPQSFPHASRTYRTRARASQHQRPRQYQDKYAQYESQYPEEGNYRHNPHRYPEEQEFYMNGPRPEVYTRHQSTHIPRKQVSVRKQKVQNSEWSTNFPAKPSKYLQNQHNPEISPSRRTKAIGLLKRVDSTFGQERPLAQKC